MNIILKAPATKKSIFFQPGNAFLHKEFSSFADNIYKNKNNAFQKTGASAKKALL